MSYYSTKTLGTPLCNRGYGTLRARVCEKKKCLSDARCDCVCVCVCVCVLANYLD